MKQMGISLWIRTIIKIIWIWKTANTKIILHFNNRISFYLIMAIEITKCIKTTTIMDQRTKTNTIKKSMIKIIIFKTIKIKSRMKNLMDRKIWREISKT
jgi:hypothetical protein